VRTLIRAGATLNLPDKFGMMAQDWAAEVSHTTISEMLAEVKEEKT